MAESVYALVSKTSPKGCGFESHPRYMKNKFQIGDLVVKRKTNGSGDLVPDYRYRGIISNIIPDNKWGDIIEIEMDSHKYMDYFYTFIFDIEKIRNKKIENLLNADIV